MCPPHSPTRMTKNSILKLAGAFHCPKTSRIRFWAFSYSMGEPCGRSNQLITYCMLFFSFELRDSTSVLASCLGKTFVKRPSRTYVDFQQYIMVRKHDRSPQR